MTFWRFFDKLLKVGIRNVSMAEITLFTTSPGVRNKRENLFREIVPLHPENDLSGVLYLAPNAFTLATVKRQFFSFSKKERKKSAYIPFQAFTIKQLALQIFETFNPPNSQLLTLNSQLSVVSGRIRTLLLCEIMGGGNIGYAQLLSELFRKSRHYILNKDLSQLKEDVKSLIFEEKAKERAVKAMEILQSYEDFLEEKELIDAEDVMRDCISIIRRNKEQRVKIPDANPQSLTPNPFSIPCPLPLKSTLVIDGFFDPTPLELEFINTLTENADRAVILAEENTELLRCFLSRKDVRSITKLERSAHRETTGYYSYNSIEAEVEGIAKNIKKLILEGVKPWEITVSFPSLSQYLPRLRRVFNKHGVPASIGECGLSETKPFALLEEMIACIENDYPRNDFLSVLTSPCFPVIHDAVKKRAVTLSYRAGIIKGKESWLSIEGILKISDDDMSEDEKERIKEFQKGIKPVVDALENIKNAPDITAFVNAFEYALDKLGFFNYLKNPKGGDTPLTPLDRGEFSDQISHSITNLFSELRRFAGLYGAALHAGDAGFYLRYLLRDLTASGEDVDGVKILPYELAAALESKALFFGGVLEGGFPSRPGIDPVLPEKVKKALGIPHLEYYLERQRVYFTRLLNVSALDPYISCPAADGDKIFLPSPFLDWDKMVCPADLNIFTEEDVLAREGSELKLNNKSRAETYFDAKAAGLLRGRVGAMSKRYFRVTDLDYYRKCPFKFYLEKILNLEMEKPPRFEVEYRQWGNLAHKTMEYLFKDKDWELDDLEKRLFNALEKSLKDIPVGDFWADVTREIFRNLLPLLKKQEPEIRMKGFNPYLTEEKIEAEIDGIKLRGKIDRIDRKKSEVRSQKSEVKEQRTTDNGQRKTVLLLDYKTGSIDKDSLQLPLYARMWQEGHSEQVEEVGYYSLKEGKVNWYPPKKKSMEEFIREALDETVALIRQMKKGMFPAEPSGNECRVCSHGALCGKG